MLHLLIGSFVPPDEQTKPRLTVCAGDCPAHRLGEGTTVVQTLKLLSGFTNLKACPDGNQSHLGIFLLETQNLFGVSCRE
jgi:hypothetical protein